VAPDPHDPRGWVRHWPEWDTHDLNEWLRDIAYEQGRQAGRDELAGEMLPALRWLLAGVDVDLQLVDEAELEELLAPMVGDFHALMARHLRRIEQRHARVAGDEQARAAG
jgi:hypothetical protein